MLYDIFLLALLTGQQPGVTLQEIQTLPPQELGQKLLTLPPPKIVEAYLYSEHLTPPTRPGQAVVTRVMMYGPARESGEEGFCEKVRYLVRLKPVVINREGVVPPSTTAMISPETLYRLKLTDGENPTCEAPGGDFLSVSDGDAPAVFSMIRFLAGVQADLAEGKPLDVEGGVDDELGRAENSKPGASRPITDWKEALRLFPTTEISSYRRSEEGDSYAMSFYARDWRAVLTLRKNYSVGRISFLRFTPPPP